MKLQVVRADAERMPFADRCADLVIGSPPYCDARTYGIGAQRDCGQWIEWMLLVTREALRVSRGAVVWVASNVTRDRDYWPACEGLMYRWWADGGSMYRPCFWHRVGIPGSGGDQWFRSDVEFVMLFKRPGKLPWADNKATGHAPRWAPGGEMSHRVSDGTRINQPWGDGGRMPETRDKKVVRVKMTRSRRAAHGDGRGENESGEWPDRYAPPAIANHGNLLHTNVGGGQLGHKLAHKNEAPYPVEVPEFFIRSLCPPGGTVLDPFSGSGTTAHAAIQSGRNAICSDLRSSECANSLRRAGQTTGALFAC